RAFYLYGDRYGLSRFPALFLVIVGDAPDGVNRIIPDIRHPVAIKINSIATEATGNKLAIAHGTGVRAGQHQGIEALLPRHQEILFQLGTEKPRSEEHRLNSSHVK